MSGRRGDILDVTTPLGAVPPCLSIDTQLSRPITNATGVGAILQEGAYAPTVGPYGEGPSPINRDSTPPTSSAPLYRLNNSKSLVGGTGEPRELAGLHALFETTKAGRRWTLSLGKGRRGLSTADAVHLSGKGKACSDIRFPRKIKLVSRVMGNLPARFGEH
ncbi:hypothetical protein TSUD_335680 [Trifolium subterraneum]|uniref:Uncharacterized protein n=1 Tax=Trifolium subterraneum TaxID=3900 RepID=A0A2Z6LMK4_TRISU|nr:hypothetical protein TSUD_335680 [Trifolium subterraneum]